MGEIGVGFMDQVLTSLDKAASEFWASIRPYFLAYVARGPAMALPSFTSPADKYFWGKSCAHWEQSGTWLDLDSPEAWRRHVNACGCAYGRNEPIKDVQVRQNVVDYVRNSLGNDRFSDAAMKCSTD